MNAARKNLLLLAAAPALVSIACLAWDARAAAAEPKRVLLLVLTLVGLGLRIASGGPLDGRISLLGGVAALFFGVSLVSVAFGIPSGRLDLATWAIGLGIGARTRRVDQVADRRRVRTLGNRQEHDAGTGADELEHAGSACRQRQAHIAVGQPPQRGKARRRHGLRGLRQHGAGCRQK